MFYKKTVVQYVLLRLYKVLVCLLKFWLASFTYPRVALCLAQVSGRVPAQEVLDVPPLLNFFKRIYVLPDF